MSQQFGQPPAHGYHGGPPPSQPLNYNGNPSLVTNQMANLSLSNGLPPSLPTSQMQPPLPPQQQQPPALKQMPPQQINRGFPPSNNNTIPPNASQSLPSPPSTTGSVNGLAQQNQHFVSNGSNQNYPTPHSQSQQLSPSGNAPPLPQQPRPNAQTPGLNAAPLNSPNYQPPPALSPLQPPQSHTPQSFAAPGQQHLPPQPHSVAHPPLPGQQQSHQLPPQQPHHLPPQQLPSMPGQQLPPMPGQQMPPMPGQQMPPSRGQQLPPSRGQQLPAMPGQQLPPLPGQPLQHQPQQPHQPQPNQFAGQHVSQPYNSLPPMGGLPHMPPQVQNNYQSQPMGGGNYPQAGNYPQSNMPPQPNRPQYAQPAGGNFNQGNYGSGPHPPGMPGQNPPGNYGPGPYPPGMPGQNPPGMAAPPPQRRLDPDQMPNPIQVMSENQSSITGPFVTNDVGLVPPLVTTKFITHDQGNSGPRFIRSTMYNVPATPDMIKQTSVPFSLIISPLAKTIEGEIVPPIVDFGELGPIRCVRCKAYMSPNMQFVDAGRRFRCPLCKATTDVPAEYFQHLDHAGQRVDKYERPELVLGTYEFVATKEYCRENKPSKPPAFIFVIDVSYNNIKSGLVHLLCREMKRILQNLPIDQGHDRSTMKVGFITYNNTVHFYNVKENLAQPQMMIVGDVHEMFMPLLDGFFCDPEESSQVIDALMEQIPIMFGETRETETILLPAIQAGLEAIKASECAGKLLVFHSSLPVSDAPGRLQNREDRKLLATEKEKVVLSPQNNTYNNLGQECVLAGCSVDLFVFNNSYIDLATIGQVSRLTGGEVYKYTYFQADIDGPRVVSDIIKNISRPIAFDAVMRVRTSAGIRPTEFYGHFFMSNTTDLDMACVTSDKAVGIEIKHDDKLPPEENVYIQVALLFTSCSGQRRIRILNLALKTCVQMADLFRCCDLDAIVLYFSKQIMYKLLESTPRLIKEGLESRCAQILACYRKNCASPTSAGQLILPECMKLLPLYVSCLLKNDALSGGSDMSCDDRSYVMQFVLSMDLPMSVFYFYPRLIPIHDVNPNDEDIPAPIRCTSEKMADDGAYILENGIHMFVWLGLALAPEFTQAIFGAQCAQLVDTDRPGIPTLDNPLSKRVRGIIDSIQAERPRCMRVTVIRQRDKLENVLRHYLIEDRSGTGAASYVDYLCHLHKEIRAILS